MQFGAPLPAGFYDRDPAVVASELLGAVLRHEDELGAVSGRIVETEAYLGPHDPASQVPCSPAARRSRFTPVCRCRTMKTWWVRGWTPHVTLLPPDRQQRHVVGRRFAGSMCVHGIEHPIEQRVGTVGRQRK